MIFKKVLFVSVCAVFAAVPFSSNAFGQERDRVVKPTSSRPTNQPPAAQPAQDKTKTTSSSRPTLVNPIIVVKPQPEAPLVKKTGSSRATGMAAARSAYSSGVSMKMMAAIQDKYGIPYRYGSTGPNTYDCSGFVWKVFQEAGIDFTRSSARSIWSMSVPVEGDDRYKFGTLVFLNGLGHMGIVADENGFFHASSSKGITYSPFKGYWEKRIVGFRRLNVQPDAATEAK